MTKKSAKQAPRLGGRPSAKQAEQLRGLILDVATEFFLRDGYGATSIDAIAKHAGIAKRTFYHRFEDKADLFGAVVKRLIEGLRPPHSELLFEGKNIQAILMQLAQAILTAALSPQGLALHRVMVSEATRFPELAALVEKNGSRPEAVRRIADLLQHFIPSSRAKAEFSAEQFLQMVTGAPQRRALGLGEPMTQAECDDWAKKTVALFLAGHAAKE